MSVMTPFRWEQDGNGGEHGMAFFFEGTEYERAQWMSTFKEAFLLHIAINTCITEHRQQARAQLLEEIARIQP